MGSDELAEWMAYYSIEPWGKDADDLRMGVVSSTIANFSQLEIKRSQRKHFVPADFIPGAKSGKPEQSAAQQKMVAYMFARAHGHRWTESREKET